jgi:hypothetical protein
MREKRDIRRIACPRAAADGLQARGVGPELEERGTYVLGTFGRQVVPGGPLARSGVSVDLQDEVVMLEEVGHQANCRFGVFADTGRSRFERNGR